MGSAGPPYWQRHARRYDRAVHLLNRRIVDVAGRVAEEVRGRKVLEVAAGTGLFTVELARTAAQVVATDRSPAMLDVLRGRVAASGFTNVEVRAADATAIEAEAVSFDAVV